MAFALVATNEGVIALDADGGTHVELEGTDVRRLTRHRRGCWAAADGGSIYRRADDGMWHEFARADGAPTLTCVLPHADGAFAGTTDGRLLLAGADGVSAVTGFDEVDGQEDWHAVPSGVPYVRSLTSTADSGAVLANVHVGGIPRSIDGGQTWAPTIDPEVDVHEVRGHPGDETLVVAAAGYGFNWSDDGGVTWHLFNDGLHVTYARAVAFTSDAALVSVSNGPMATTGGAIYRWAIGTEEPLQRCLDGLPDDLPGNIDTGCLDASGEDAVLLDAVGTVYASGDDGMSWCHLADLDGITNSIVLA